MKRYLLAVFIETAGINLDKAILYEICSPEKTEQSVKFSMLIAYTRLQTLSIIFFRLF